MMKVSSVHFTPLLERKVKLGMARGMQRESFVEEFHLRGIGADPKEQMKKLKEKLMKNEHPDDSNVRK